MKTLRPIVYKDAYTRLIEPALVAYFEEVLFRPLADILATANAPDVTLDNARYSQVQAAMSAGKLWYANGVFYGQFSAAVARELRELGATFLENQRVFSLPEYALPFDLRTAAVQSIEKSRETHERVTAFLSAAEENIPRAILALEIDQALARIRGDLYKQFNDTVPQTALEFVEVSAETNPGEQAKIDREYKEDLARSIKNFLPQEISELREEVQKNAFAGYRSDRLAKIIEARYGVTKRKAVFLADQETSLMVSKFREARYTGLGLVAYKWSTSHDDRVRPDHQALNEQIFTWDSPPVTDRKTGARNHPGEDFNCRCVAIPILDAEHVASLANAKREFNCA